MEDIGGGFNFEMRCTTFLQERKKHTGVEMGIKTVFPGCLCNNIKMSKAMLMRWFLNLLSMGAPYVGHMFKAYTSVCVLWSSISFQPQLRRKQKLFLKRKNIYQQERT